MKIKLATKNNIADICKIIYQAQRLLASANIDQWQDGYPNKNHIEEDIKNQTSYIIHNTEQQIMSTVMYTTQAEPTYKQIKGKWLTKDNSRYGVIHRLAVSDKYRGLGISKFIFSHFEKTLIKNEIKSLRIDTHPDNKIMKTLMLKMGYIYCGIIHLENGDIRLAFEKILI